ncbi:hypothetical protein N7490_006757 [Penicillium lividum]|nr:hypothetical protein N7490_006757 [Penicillium lividum]
MGNRTSSAGYIYQFFSGPVDWRATKQKTMTTSTTEAELLGLSDAGRRIGFKYPEGLIIECDNRCTVDLINAEDTPFDTKLRHGADQVGTNRADTRGQTYQDATEAEA